MKDLILGDCLDVMKHLGDKSIDMILCDLPYGTTACKWDVVIPFDKLWEQYERIIKDNGAIVLFASPPFAANLIVSNLEMFRYEWIWQKSNGGGFLNANRMPLKRHENILVFYKKLPTYNPQKVKGKPYTCRSSSAGETTQDQSVAGWITSNTGDRHPTTILKYSNETGYHPTQKPVELLEYLIKTYTNEGDTVLDNCMGSGSTGVAAVNLNRNFIGIEKELGYFAIAQNRINNADQITKN